MGAAWMFVRMAMAMAASWPVLMRFLLHHQWLLRAVLITLVSNLRMRVHVRDLW